MVHRDRGWRRARAATQQRNQTHIYRAVTGKPTTDIHRSWDKQHALSCGNANCGFCRNPRFNRNSNGRTRLTLAERRINITYAEWRRAGLNSDADGEFDY